ncbi:carboxypeptidase-like regulatory domain-containing protein [Isoptericola haloaureus]|uniref:Carboxypeptidase-like regulatory domain-containing protein n=1 Tax=Isoptericola haloaureus TaxID=1542902 RepID=A0ABU7Z3Q0_9MICO
MVDWRGEPVAGASVLVWDGRISGSRAVETATDDLGYYSLDRPAGWYQVIAEPRWLIGGYETTAEGGAPVRVDAGSTTTANVTLQAAGVVQAKVVRRDGSLVSPSEVRIRIDRCWGTWDPDGRAYFRGEAQAVQAPPGTYRVCVDVYQRAPGQPRLARIKRTVTVVAGEKVNLGKLRLPATGTVTGRLNFRGDLTGPYGTMAIALETMDGTQVDVKHKGQKKSVTFRRVTPGRYRVIAIGTNTSRVVQVNARTTTTFPTFSYRLSTVSGTVRVPRHKSACVSYYDKWGYGAQKTCGGGKFPYRFGGPVKSTYRLEISSVDRVSGGRAKVTLSSGGSTARKNFWLRRTTPKRTFSGTVHTPDNRPPAALIRIPSQSASSYYQITIKVRADGTFSTSKLQRPETKFFVYDRFDRRIKTGKIGTGTHDVHRTIWIT